MPLLVSTPTSTRPPSGVQCSAFESEIRDHLEDAVAVGHDRRRVSVLDQLVVDLSPARLLGERRVRLLYEPAHVDFLGEHCEAMRPELRQVEDVSDEPLEPGSLGRDDVERSLNQLGVVDEAVAERVHVSLDRRERCAELVRDGHQEVPLTLFGFGEPDGHLVETLGKMADLAPAACFDADVVSPCGDLVGRVRQLPHRTGDPPRQVPGERSLRSAAPNRKASARRSRSGSHCRRSSVFGFATTSAPNGAADASSRSGSAAARYVRDWPGGTNSNVSVLSIDATPGGTTDAGSLCSPERSPGNTGAPT